MSAALELDQVDDLRRAYAAGLQTPPRRTVSEWADAERVLVGGAEPGPWRTERVPYLREIMDRLSPSDPCEQIVVMKAAQVGYSEGLVNNLIGYSITQDPCPILLVLPTVEEAEKYSKKRIAPMIDAHPEMRERVSPAKSRDSDNTILNKGFPGGHLTIVGSNAPAGLASIAVKRIIFDEVDRFALSAGSEGDPIALAERRATTFHDRKRLLGGTPTVKGHSRIEKAYEASDKRRLHVPCPHCGVYQVLWWDRIRWQTDEDGTHHPETAVYICAECEEPIEDRHKLRMIGLGDWVPEHPERSVPGYHITGLLSLWVPWPDVVAMFLAAKDDPVLLRVWVNTTLGETWDEDADGRLEDIGLLELRERWWPEGSEIVHVPEAAAVLTAGIDVQADRLEILVTAWGREQESWALDHRIIPGDPSGPAVWDLLEVALARMYPHPSGRDLPILAAGVDSGFMAQAVYEFCSPRHEDMIWAVKGIAGEGRRVWPRRPSKSGAHRLYAVGVDSAKDRLYARLKSTARRREAGRDSGPGMMHFPRTDWCDERYFQQLTAEVVRYKPRKGRWLREWHLPDGKRNEVLDITVYAYAALCGWLALGHRLEDAAAAIAEPVRERRPRPKRPAPPIAPRRRGKGWL